jgi:hypothetical protein
MSAAFFLSEKHARRYFADVRFGSNCDLGVHPSHVRSSPRNGHGQVGPVGPFSADFVAKVS